MRFSKLDKTGFLIINLVIVIAVIAFLFLACKFTNGIIFNAKMLKMAQTIQTIKEAAEHAQDAGHLDSSQYSIDFFRSQGYLHGFGPLWHPWSTEDPVSGGRIEVSSIGGNDPLRGYSITVSELGSNACNRLEAALWAAKNL